MERRLSQMFGENANRWDSEVEPIPQGYQPMPLGDYRGQDNQRVGMYTQNWSGNQTFTRAEDLKGDPNFRPNLDPIAPRNLEGFYAQIQAPTPIPLQFYIAPTRIRQ